MDKIKTSMDVIVLVIGKLLLSLLEILAPYEQDYCINKYDELVNAKDNYILTMEPYCTANMKKS